jgi:rRNA pseudouridine-1189 N-methylase Emg1 (Nep1/Mra1 family)
LQLHSIRGNNGPDKLLKCIKGPVTNYLPTKCLKLSKPCRNSHLARSWLMSDPMAIALSADAEPVKLSDYVTTLPETHSIAIFIGAMARGEDNFADDVVDQKISISKYSLSASVSSWRSWRTSHGFSYSLRIFSGRLRKVLLCHRGHVGCHIIWASIPVSTNCHSVYI